MNGEEDLVASVRGTDEQRALAYERLVRAYIRSRFVLPISTPWGLDAVIAILRPVRSHSEYVALLHTPWPDLDDLTPIQWLIEEGSASEVITVLTRAPGATSASVLVTELRLHLGAKLVAYLTSVPSTTLVSQWADGVRKPDENTTRRLASAFEVATVLIGQLSKTEAQVWMQESNARLGDTAPARVLREDTFGHGSLAVLAAARSHVARAYTSLDPDVELVLARTHELFSGRAVCSWLSGSNQYLDGARPIDLITLGRCGEVLDALDAAEQGGMG